MMNKNEEDIKNTLEVIELYLRGGSMDRLEFRRKNSTTWCRWASASYDLVPCVHDYRLRPLPAIVPWQKPEQCIGKVVKRKEQDSTVLYFITMADTRGCVINSKWADYTTVCAEYVQQNGSPCGLTEEIL